MSALPEVIDYLGTQWVRMDVVQEREQRLAAVDEALTEANRRLAEIRDELCGHKFQVIGWHENGCVEPIESWWEDNNWGPVEAKGGE